MLLSELIETLPVHADLSSDPNIVDVTDDSREVEPGWLFVARQGTTRDGARYVADAVTRGAAAVVTQQPLDVTVPAVQVPRAGEALPELAARIHGYPSRRLVTLGVTGTDGKTTTCYLAASILRASGLRTGMVTTVETCVGGSLRRSSGRLTTPGAAATQRLLHAMVDAGDTHVVLECSSHALDQKRLEGVELSAAAITNIGSDHLDYHGSRERYIAAKSQIVELLHPSTHPRLVVNLEDRDSVAIAANSGLPFLTFGLNPKADVRGSDIRVNGRSSRWLLVAQGGEMSVDLPIGGRFNVYNALAAATLALSVGIRLEDVARGLASATPPSGRLQRLDSSKGFTVVVDYAHTEQAFLAVLSQLREEASATRGRLLSVFGAAGDRDREKRPRLAAIAGDLADYFIITTEDPFGEDGSAIIKDVAAGAPASRRGTQWDVVEDRGLAIGRVLAMARPGDVVAVTGKGHEQSIAEGDTLIPWSDVDVIRQMLSGEDEIDGMGGEGSIPSSHERVRNRP